MTRYEVRYWFAEAGREVYEVQTFGDRWECYLLSLAEGVMRGPDRVHVTRARLVPWDIADVEDAAA